MMASELAKIVAAIGKTAMWNVRGLEVPVEIVDAKIAYGRVYYLIKSSVSGNVEKWTTDENITISKEVLKGAWEVVKTSITHLF